MLVPSTAGPVADNERLLNTVQVCLAPCQGQATSRLLCQFPCDSCVSSVLNNAINVTLMSWGPIYNLISLALPAPPIGRRGI